MPNLDISLIHQINIVIIMTSLNIRRYKDYQLILVIEDYLLIIMIIFFGMIMESLEKILVRLQRMFQKFMA